MRDEMYLDEHGGLKALRIQLKEYRNMKTWITFIFTNKSNFCLTKMFKICCSGALKIAFVSL